MHGNSEEFRRAKRAEKISRVFAILHWKAPRISFAMMRGNPQRCAWKCLIPGDKLQVTTCILKHGTSNMKHET